MGTLAKRLRYIRKERDLNQETLAQMAGLEQSLISKIERGVIQKTTGLVALANALRCNPQWLNSGDGPMEPATAQAALTAPSGTLAATGSPSNPALAPADPAQAAMNFDRQSRVSLSQTALATIDFADFAVLDANSVQVVQGLFRSAMEHPEIADSMAAAIKNIIESSKAKRQSQNQMATEATEAKQYTPDQRRTGTHG